MTLTIVPVTATAFTTEKRQVSMAGLGACHKRVEKDGAENSGDEDYATEGALMEQIRRVHGCKIALWVPWGVMSP